MPTITISDERCKGCERCVDACPQGIVKIGKRLNARGFYYARLDAPPRCLGCRLCAIVCPDNAIEVFVEGTQYAFFQY